MQALHLNVQSRLSATHNLSSVVCSYFYTLFLLSDRGPKEGKEKQIPRKHARSKQDISSRAHHDLGHGVVCVWALLSAAFHSIYFRYVQCYYNPHFPSNVNNLFSSAAQGHGSGIFQQRRELYCSGAAVCGRIHPR